MINYTRNQDGTGTITISFSRPQAEIEPFIEDLAEALYDDITGNFSLLTNQEKLAVIQERVRSFFVSRVKSIRESRAIQAVDRPGL